MPSLILIAAFDVLGENTSIHLEKLPVTLAVGDIATSSGIGAVRFGGNDGDASKLSQIVGEVTGVAS